MVNNALLRSRKSGLHPRIWDDVSFPENKIERTRNTATILHVGPTRAKRRPKVDQRGVVNCVAATILFAIFFKEAALRICSGAQTAQRILSKYVEQGLCRLERNLVLPKRNCQVEGKE